MSLSEKLEKLKSPKLQNQRETAIVLGAVEQTLQTQNCEFTPAAYFAALIALLNQSISKESIVNKELATSVVYLLDLVTSHVPVSLLRSKFEPILTTLAPVLRNPDADAPLIKASIGSLESLLVAQDQAAWNLPQTQIGPRRALAGLLILAQDHRPKVRRRAQDAVTKILQSAPPSPSLEHPAADMCAETAMKGVTDILAKINVSGKKNRKEKRRNGEEHHPELLHALQLVKTIASASGGWPSRKIEPLCEILMQLTRGNEWLTMMAFEIFEMMFQGMSDEVASAKLPALMRAIDEAKPTIGDDKLIPSWCAVTSRAFGVSATLEPQETFQKLPDTYHAVKSFCASSNYEVRVSASECLISFLANCIPRSTLLEPSIYDEKVMEKIAESSSEMLNIKFQSAWMEVFNVLSHLFVAFKWRSVGLLDQILKVAGELRESDVFTGKKEADLLIGKAVESMGPINVLKVLPLNLSDPRPGHPGRAWLLPILRDHVRNTELAHFRSEMVPLSELMYQRVLENGTVEKTIEIKIFETLVQQFWGMLPGYCTLAIDIPKAFDQGFAEMLANLLYQQTELRADICGGLQAMVESHRTFLASDMSEEDRLLDYRLSKKEAQEAIDHLASFSGNLLAVLFNVYSQTLPHLRGYILQCIDSYLSITPAQSLLETFERVAKMLEDALKDTTKSRKVGKQQKNDDAATNTMPPASHTLMDLIITLAIYLPRPTFAPLFELAAQILPLQDDPQLQKKAYKLIPRIAKCPTGQEALRERNAELQQLLLSTSQSASLPARRDRLTAISSVVEHLPDTELHFIPAILSEVVLACKDNNEKARNAGFELLIAMAQRMSDGGTVQQSKIPHMEASAPDAAASLEEFFTMVAAGLVGNTPHMVSASITALTRVLFHFVDKLPHPVLEDLLQTISVFLNSTNKEIVRSVLGFAKVALLSLPEDIVQPRLESLIPGIFSWSHEHKARFRSKIKHLLERAIRRFGFEAIEQYAPDEDKKLLNNIRKTRERRKKKKRAGEDDNDDDDDDAAETNGGGKQRFESEYDEALYGSDDSSASSHSSDGEADDPAPAQRRSKGKGRGGEGDAYITETGDEPLDLLDRKTLANISSSRPQAARKIPSGRNRGKTDIDGKLVFKDGNKADKRNGKGDDDDAMNIDPGESINAYVEAVSGKDAVQRGQRGRLKFDTRRKRGEGTEMDEDDGETDAPTSNGGKKVRFAGKEEAKEVPRGGKKSFQGKPVGKSFQARRGGISKRVQRKPLGGGKVSSGRVEKGGVRR